MSAEATSRCPVPTCGIPTLPEHLMCRRHWYRVPKPLRAEVWRAWHNRKVHPREAGARARHRAAMAAAIKAVSPTSQPEGGDATVKSLSISISGGGQVSDELAAKAQEVAAELKDAGFFTSVAISDVCDPAPAAATEDGAPQAP